MSRRFAVALVLTAFLVYPVAAQTTSTTDATNLAANTPAENASGGFVAARSPGTWVKAALSRHNGLQGIRLTGPRFGQPNTEEGAIRAAGNTGTSGTSTAGGLSSLLGLVSQLGGLDSLADLTNTGANTNTGTGDTDYTLEDLIALGQAYENSQQKSSNAASRSSVNTQAGGAIARLPKRAQTAQSTTTTTTTGTTESSFAVRWTNAILGTFFSALSVGFQSSAFITMLEDALRPLVLPGTENADDGNTNNNGNSQGIEGLDGSGGGNDGSSTL
ncbi:MAG TPA: hypothetical protein PLP66_04225 [Phycisphaerae bacterium]|nr:hypothetical protein [Phycisphaerae bacterium]